MKKMLILASLMAAMTTSQATAAEQGSRAHPVARTQTVSYADIDLGSKKGAVELQRRVRIAVESVCGEASQWDLSGTIRVKRCYRDTMKIKSAEAAQAIALANSEVRIADAR